MVVSGAEVSTVKVLVLELGLVLPAWSAAVALTEWGPSARGTIGVKLQLPPALAVWLGERSLSATPVRDLGLRESDDGSIWNFATTGGWIVVTKDEDFVARCIGNPTAPAVVWLRLGNCTNRALFMWLEPFLAEIVRRLKEGEKLIEVR